MSSSHLKGCASSECASRRAGEVECHASRRKTCLMKSLHASASWAMCCSVFSMANCPGAIKLSMPALLIIKSNISLRKVY